MVTGPIFAKWALVAVVLVVLGAVAPSSGTGIKLPFRFPHSGPFELLDPGVPEDEYYFPLSSNNTVCVGNVVYNAKKYNSFSYWVKPAGCVYSPPTCNALVINLHNGDIPDSVSIEMPTEEGNWTEVVATLSGRDDFKSGIQNKYVLAFCCEADADENAYYFRRFDHGFEDPDFSVFAECTCECEECECEVDRPEEPFHMTVDYESGRRRGEPRHLKDRVLLVPTVVPVAKRKRSKTE